MMMDFNPEAFHDLMILLVLVGLGLLSVVFCYITVGSRRKDQWKRLPPGPPGIPILGNLFLLGKLPHRDLYSLAKQYGSIMLLHLGCIPTVIVSSPEAAHEFLKTHDLIFASRPCMEMGKYFTYGNKALSVSKYGPYWRGMRKLCTVHLLSRSKIESFSGVRERELALFIKSIKDSRPEHGPVDISLKVYYLIADITCLMIFGKKYTDQDASCGAFRTAIREMGKIAGKFNLADFIPYIGIFDFQGLRWRMKKLHQLMDAFCEQIIDEHKNSQKNVQTKDFVDVMLALMESRNTEIEFQLDNVKAVIQEMLGGGMDTSATAIEWAFSEVLRNPRVMKKLRSEIDAVVGVGRMVSELDLPKLEYLEMVVKESLRIHPVAPLLLPHEANEACIVGGFYIPKNARVLVNTWAIGHDLDAWPNPDVFLPERFQGNCIDVMGQDFHFLPFGAGRRQCPGMQLGLIVTQFVLAQLVHCFDWELPKFLLPEELDMSEEFGLTVSRAHHLHAIPTYRLTV